MRSIKFPKMFGPNFTRTWQANEYNKATIQNMKLLVCTERGELFGDPYFGLLLKRYMYEQNNAILKEVLVDMLYTQLALFIPQVKIERKDISVVQNQALGKVVCQFYGTSQIDFTLNNYQLALFDIQ